MAVIGSEVSSPDSVRGLGAANETMQFQINGIGGEFRGVDWRLEWILGWTTGFDYYIAHARDVDSSVTMPWSKCAFAFVSRSAWTP